jgi:hypothetical protein
MEGIIPKGLASSTGDKVQNALKVVLAKSKKNKINKNKRWSSPLFQHVPLTITCKL